MVPRSLEWVKARATAKYLCIYNVQTSTENFLTRNVSDAKAENSFSRPVAF